MVKNLNIKGTILYLKVHKMTKEGEVLSYEKKVNKNKPGFEPELALLSD